LVVAARRCATIPQIYTIPDGSRRQKLREECHPKLDAATPEAPPVLASFALIFFELCPTLLSLYICHAPKIQILECD
jgi:hypothetical protein